MLSTGHVDRTNPITSHSASLENGPLNEFDLHIRSQVIKRVRHYSWLFHPDVIDMEVDDIVQDIRIRFWEVSHKRPIRTPKSYLNRMIHNRMADLARGYKPICPIQIDEYGELYQGDMIIAVSQGMRDPLYEIEQEEIERDNIHIIVEFISTLPSKQQYAMLCHLKPLAKVFFELEIALQEQNIDLNRYEWPKDPHKKQKLKVSLSVAKKKLALYLRRSSHEVHLDGKISNIMNMSR